MQVPRSIFREYDVRGLVDEQLTPAFAEHLGRAVTSEGVARFGGLDIVVAAAGIFPPTKPITDPTDRSMCPETITSSMPIAMMTM